MYKRENGITLITLIITVIVMAILTGIVVSFAYTNLSNKANQVVNRIDNQATTEIEQEANIKNTWTDTPGHPIKGVTAE